jgi:hypothetical protein
MTEYTSTLAGFQKAMEWSLTGPPEDGKNYVEATSIPSFYRVFNGEKMSYEKNLSDIEMWRGRSVKYYPKVYVLPPSAPRCGRES